MTAGIFVFFSSSDHASYIFTIKFDVFLQFFFFLLLRQQELLHCSGSHKSKIKVWQGHTSSKELGEASVSYFF